MISQLRVRSIQRLDPTPYTLHPKPCISRTSMMPTPPPPGTTGPAGNLPGTESLGVIYLEYVDVERKSGGVWGQIAGNVPATFEPLKIHTRTELETWSHKPLYGLWLFPG